MSWFGAEIEGPMIVTRTVHFAASATIAGALIFTALKWLLIIAVVLLIAGAVAGFLSRGKSKTLN